MRTASLSSIVALLIIGAVYAQGHNPYAGEHERSVKALSDDEARQYLAGAGMGYAKAAELNGFPGPMHVLELADKLGLSSEQRSATQDLMAAHRAEARAIGAKRMNAEKELDALFKSGNIRQDRLAESVRTAMQLEGEYRLSHLETHRRMRALLTDHQVVLYNELRGYGAKPKDH